MRDTELLTPEEVLERFTAGPKTGVFTDGSCEGNPGPGGWAAIRVDGDEIVQVESGGDPDTTNNRMELEALIAGLKMLAEDAESSEEVSSEAVASPEEVARP